MYSRLAPVTIVRLLRQGNGRHPADHVANNSRHVITEVDVEVVLFVDVKIAALFLVVGLRLVGLVSKVSVMIRVRVG